jgi:hypothetical protein
MTLKQEHCFKLQAINRHLVPLDGPMGGHFDCHKKKTIMGKRAIDKMLFIVKLAVFHIQS